MIIDTLSLLPGCYTATFTADTPTGPHEAVPAAPLAFGIVRIRCGDFTPRSAKTGPQPQVSGLSHDSAVNLAAELNARRIRGRTFASWAIVVPTGKSFGVLVVRCCCRWEPSSPTSSPPGVVHDRLTRDTAQAASTEMNEQRLEVTDRPKSWFIVFVPVR